MKLLSLLSLLLLTVAASLTPQCYCRNHGLQELRGGGDDDSVAEKAQAAATAKVTRSLVRIGVEDLKRVMLGDWSARDKIFAALAVIATVSSAFAMIVESSTVVTVVGWLCIATGSSAAVLQKKLSEFETMRELTARMQEEVTSLAEENKSLCKENVKLEKSTEKLQKAEADLAVISATQGISIDKLVAQVEEYKLIQQRVHNDLISKVKQTLLSAVMSSDVDQDYQISADEVDMLVLRLTAIPNVEFDEARFRKAIKKDNGSLVTFMNDHLQNDVKMGKEKIFTLVESK